MMRHVARPAHLEEVPVHVTVRAVPAAPYLRSERVFAALRAIFARASEKGFALLQYSVQANHLHLIVEATDGVAFARGVQRLLSRIAMAVNAIARRSGRLWSDRHHRKPLLIPSQMRNAYVYVLFNHRRHTIPGQPGWEVAFNTFDAFSSFAWFDGWAPESKPSATVLARAGPPQVSRPSTWLAATGWRRTKRGLIRFEEVPRGE
jgi:putative transposase